MSVSPRRIAAENAEEAIREQLRSEESDMESHFALNTASQTQSISPENTENTENNEHPLKSSASSESLSSQRSVPRRRAAYKAAARIRRIVKKEAESESDSDTESTRTEDLKPTVCSTRVCAPEPESEPEPEPANVPQANIPLLTVPQTFLLSALLLLAFVEMANWFSPCSCPV